VGGPSRSCERLWAIHRAGEAKDQPVESTWSLRRSRGSYTLARVLQQGLVESADSPIPQEKLSFESLTHLYSGIYFGCFTFLE